MNKRKFDDDATFNLKDAAAYLGLCRASFKKIVDNGEIPHRKTVGGGRYLFAKATLDEWKKGERVNPS